jgi:hypothetical protein
MPDWNVEVELVDGHTMTVLVEDSEDAFVAACSVGDRLVKRARSKLIAPACSKCWNSGIERAGAFMPRVPDQRVEVRRVICECEHGRALLGQFDSHRYTEDPTSANAEPEGEARQRTDGVRGFVGETYLPGGTVIKAEIDT